MYAKIIYNSYTYSKMYSHYFGKIHFFNVLIFCVFIQISIPLSRFSEIYTTKSLRLMMDRVNYYVNNISNTHVRYRERLEIEKSQQFNYDRVTSNRLHLNTEKPNINFTMVNIFCFHIDFENEYSPTTIM